MWEKKKNSNTSFPWGSNPPERQRGGRGWSGCSYVKEKDKAY